MKLTIIETGKPPLEIRDRYPGYPAMFEGLLAPAAPALTFEAIALTDGEALPDPATLEAVLITGSPAGVYDPEPWMPSLMDFIRWCAAEGVPQVGICFGHQAIAQALGGAVAKSDKGWGVGRHSYDVVSAPTWMGTPSPDTFSLLVSHQDQVLSAPPGARSVASSEFAPCAALHYDTVPAISVQGHPEFSPAFAADLYRLRRARIGETLAETAIASVETPADGSAVAEWIARFLAQTPSD